MKESICILLNDTIIASDGVAIVLLLRCCVLLYCVYLLLILLFVT